MLLGIVFLLLAILSFQKKSKYIDELIVFILLVIVSIVLAHKASDFPIYKDFFIKIEPLNKVFSGQPNNIFSNDNNNYEIGYRLINSFFKIFTNHIEILYIACTSYILYTVYKLFSGKSSNMFMLLMPYFIFILITVQVGIIRQMIAISIFFYSIQFIQKREFLKFLICSIVAFCFHRTAIVLPLFYFIANREYSNILLFSLLVVGLLIFVGILPFSPLKIVEKLNSYITIESVHNKLVFYLWQTKNLPVPSKFNRGIFENTGIGLLLIYLRYDLIKKEKFNEFLNISFNLAMTYIFIYIYFFDVSSFSYRLNYYLIIFKFFIIVSFIESLEKNTNKIIANGLLVVYCLLMMLIRIGQGF